MKQLKLNHIYRKDPLCFTSEEHYIPRKIEKETNTLWLDWFKDNKSEPKRVGWSLGNFIYMIKHEWVVETRR